MKESQLNRIALSLGHDDVVSVVRMMSTKYELRFRDITSYEYECYSKIGKAIELYGTSIRNLTSYAKRICGKVAKVHLERRSVGDTVSLYSGEDDEFIEVQDVLANVESGFIENESLNEKITLLAQRDSRKLFVLSAWCDGLTNSSEISRMLAHSFGGTVESHRKFVNRFKTECQTRLAVIA